MTPMRFLIVLILSFSALLGVQAEDKVEKLVILGAGPAGLTSAIYAGQANLKPLVFGCNECAKRLVINKMDNFPGFPEGIEGRDLIDQMQLQAQKFGARFQTGFVVDVDVSRRPFRLTIDDGSIVYAESMIVAMGTVKRWLGLNSEEALKGKGICGSAACEAPRFAGKEVVVLGAGDTAMEEALALAAHASKVTIIHNTDSFYASPYLQDKVFSDNKIQVIWDSVIEEVKDVDLGKVTGLVLYHLKTEEKSFYPCDGVFVAVGRKTNIDIFKGQLEMTPDDVIKVDPHSTQTSVPGIFAAGDAADSIYRKAITAAGMGCMAAIDAIRYLKNNPQP